MSHGSLLEWACHLFRTPAAFRMELRGWSDARLQAAGAEVGCLPDAYRLAYREESAYRRLSECRGGRETWE